MTIRVIKFSIPKIRKMKRTMGDNLVMVMVDSGASHNFVSQSMIHRLGLPIIETKVIMVKLGDGHQVMCMGICKQLELMVNGVSIVVYFHLFNLGGVGVILGIFCLETLGEVKVNWRTLCISFDQNRKKMKLQRDHSLCSRLPPNCERHHTIPLLPKKGLYKMLLLRIIQPSTSPYSSIVLLGYHQIRMRVKDISKTTFRTHHRHYGFLFMSFDLTNAPTIFQAIIYVIFKPYFRILVLVFFDDILIYSQCWQDHLLHVKMKNANFGKISVGYLGHIISFEGVAMDEEKIKSEVRDFLGLIGYYRKSVKDYGKIARPLTNLLKKEGFLWTEETIKAFARLK
ncbi:Retrovirus-related Pol polyprotein, partial [Mucuna pruriens]